MTINEDNILTERNESVNVISEIPAKPFRITMEFPLFFTMMALYLSAPVMANVIMYRTCVHPLGHTEEECKHFLSPGTHNSSSDLEKEVQKYTTYVFTTKLIGESLGPAVLSLFLGGWSDTHGRKPLVVWSLLGMCMSSMMTVVYTMMQHLGPWWYVVTAIPHSLFGGFTALFTGSFCYVNDITDKSSRSFRLTLLEISFAAGGVVGGLTSSYLLKTMGAVYLLLVVSTLYVTAYAFTNVYLPESLTGAVRGGLSTLLDITLVKEMINTCFKKRPNYGRAKILFLTMANTIPIFILYGTSGLEYLYTRTKLNWSMRDYTVYNASSTSISVFGAFVGLILIQRTFGVSDLLMSIMAFLSCMVNFMIRIFAVKTWHMYFGASIAMLQNLGTPLIRSFLTKTVPVEEIGQVFSLMCAMEAIICPLIGPPVFNALYAYTISTFPGSIYALSAALTVIVVLIQIYVIYLSRRTDTNYQPLHSEENMQT